MSMSMSIAISSPRNPRKSKKQAACNGGCRQHDSPRAAQEHPKSDPRAFVCLCGAATNDL